ncbi:hypothetical protein PILCRDRAFT_64497, partial [Piloderma croceum F 1598]
CQTLGDWLCSLNFNLRQADILSQRTEGTGQWFLKSDEFQSWKLSAGSEILWCKGIPGSGKTILSAIAIDHLQRALPDESIAIAFVYCNHKEQATQNLRELIAGLLKQFIQRHPVISASVNSLYDKHHRMSTRPNLDELKEVLRMEVDRYSKVFIIIDALDELVERGRGRLIKEVQSLANVRLLITSRPLAVIEQILLGEKSIDIRAHEEDVRKYVKHRIDILDKSRASIFAGGEEVKDKICINVRDMFLLAKLHMDALETKNTIKAVRDALDVLPAELDDTYREAMDRIAQQSRDDEALAKRVLMWITYAERPLSLMELRHAVSTLPGMTDIDSESLVQEQLLTSVCAGLVAVDEDGNIVRLIHYTAQEYFEANGSTLFQNAAADITQACLTYISFDALTKQNYAELRWPWSDYSLHHYAALHWGHHARRNEEATLEMVQTFLSRKPAVTCAIAVLLKQEVDEYSMSTRADFGQIHILSYFGLQKLIHRLLKNGCSADSGDSKGQTPLSHAVRQEQLEVIRLFLARRGLEANSKDRSGRSPLSVAAKRGNLEIVQLLLAQGDVEVDSNDEFGRSPLSRGCRSGLQGGIRSVASGGDVEVVQLLLAQGDVEVDSKNEFGRSPLSYAAEGGHFEVVQLLLARGDVEVDSKDQSGRSPLSCAAEGGHFKYLEVVQLLLARGDVEADSKDHSGRSPLSYAASGENFEAVQLLLAQGDVEADSKDQSGRSPLSYAAEGGHFEVVQLLLARGDVEVDSKDQSGRSPLSCAAEGGHFKVVQLLLARGDADSKDQSGCSPFSYAASGGNFKVVQLLLARGDVEVDSKDQFGCSPLSYAASRGNIKVVQLLLAQGDVEADSKDQSGRSPLLYAASGGNFEVVQLLLAHGDVEVYSKDQSGYSPLLCAAEGGHFKVVQLLLAQGDVKVDQSGCLPLSYATEGIHS